MTTTLGTYVYDEAHVDHKQAVGTGKSKYSKLAAIFFFFYWAGSVWLVMTGEYRKCFEAIKLFYYFDKIMEIATTDIFN